MAGLVLLDLCLEIKIHTWTPSQQHSKHEDMVRGSKACGVSIQVSAHPSSRRPP